ncbi:MAG: LLM class flavin-dependent oxidoreductase [Chloroflexi bacterium]|nr:LLM class flavin-dependent oxidoreductase [Chloroflexota bacterium]
MPKFDIYMYQDPRTPPWLELAKAADQHGFKHLWMIDSTDVYPDYYVHSGIYAVNTSHIRIGPSVTNPRTRHPRVTANAMLTIYEVSGGRAILGVGSGDHAVKTLGQRRANLSEMKEAVQVWREKFREKGADIPIYIAIGGPLMTAFAFREADGIIGLRGNTPETLWSSYQRIAAGLKEAGRDVKKVTLVAGMSAAIAYDRRVAYDDARGVVARGMLRMIKDLPQEWPQGLNHLRADAEKVAEAYNYMDHLKSHVPHSQLVSDALVEEFGGPAGTPAEVLAKLKPLWEEGKRIEAEGVDLHFNVSAPGKGKKRSIELFMLEILPHLN